MVYHNFLVRSWLVITIVCDNQMTKISYIIQYFIQCPTKHCKILKFKQVLYYNAYYSITCGKQALIVLVSLGLY